jgi:hypothetical protein
MPALASGAWIMAIQRFASLAGSIAIAALISFANPALADVSVSINGNIATALVELPSAETPTYTATVTITFDSVVNLTRDSLNLTAQIVDPNAFVGLPNQVSIDPNFPVLISVEPPVPLFLNGFEAGETGNGSLYFFNTYELEIHTVDLACASSGSTYRLYKAPHGSNSFGDVTDDLFQGSVRARGRGGAFSQFVIANDQRPQTILGLPVIALQKLTALTTRLLGSASITGALLTTLTDLLGQVSANLLTLNIGGALGALSNFIADVTAGAQNGQIANEWAAGGSLSNDAGELLSLAQTLNFTLQLLQGAPVCQSAPN